MLALLLAQTSPELAVYLQIINAGGTIGTLVIGTWLFVTNRIVPGSTVERLIAERNAKDEQIAMLHKEAQATGLNIQDKVIPALVETTLIMREMRRGSGG